MEAQPLDQAPLSRDMLCPSPGRSQELLPRFLLLV